MDVKIEPSWKLVVQSEFDQPYFKNLVDFVREAYRTTTCFPPSKQIFAAFDYCPFDQVKVVIIGQDPYHGARQANGLCFSVNDGIALPPSLQNIFKELQQDLNLPIPSSGNLERWAHQGVLLLNATLSVQQALPGSHQNQGWEQFTDAVIRKISAEREGVVFLLWGSFAKSKSKLIDSSKHYILQSGHPSPMSANKGHWFGNKHFSKANGYLQGMNKEPINW
jgi:uracil-DNA glycosylase